MFSSSDIHWKNILPGFVTLLFCTISSTYAITPFSPSNHQQIEAKLPIVARAFPLSQVRLADGPFKEAQQRDLAYLL